MPEVNTHAEYNTTYAATFRARRPELLAKFNAPMIKAVMDSSDVLGLSHYAPSPQRGISAGDFGLPIDTAAFELSQWGFDLKVGRQGGAMGGVQGQNGVAWPPCKVWARVVRAWYLGGHTGPRAIPRPRRLLALPPQRPQLALHRRHPQPPPPQRFINDPKKEFLFSEVGLGGGDNANQHAAGSLNELANNIHNGIWAVYNVAQDPWRNADYKEFRREWFK